MYKDIFISLGLSHNEAIIYEYLLKNGEVSAGEIIKNTPLKRGITYNDLENLLKKSLISKRNKNKVAYFSPEHPGNLTKLIDVTENKLQKAKNTLENQFITILSSFNLVSGQPGITYLEGIDGLKRVYAEIIKDKEDILLFRSVADDKYLSIDKLVKNQISRQVKNNIRTRVITPLGDDTPFAVISHDLQNLVERRIVPSNKFSLPAQIIIFKNKVAITSLDKNIITTIIENDSISLSFRIIFNFIWDLSAQIHEELYQKIITQK